MSSKLVFTILLLTFSTSQCANILYMLLLPSPSHHIWNRAIFNELADRGHNLTVISPYHDKNAPSRVHYIPFENEFKTDIIEIVKECLNSTKSMSGFYENFLTIGTYSSVCLDALHSNGFRILLNYPNDFKFDLIVNDFSIGSCLLPFLHKFNYPPLVAVSAYGHPPFLNDLIGGHHYYAYVPFTMSTFNDTMTFSQRFLNFLFYIEETLLFEYFLNPKLDAYAAKYFDANVPSIRELEHRTVLALINTNSAMDFSSPLPENVIPVAGVHIMEPKPLPEDLNAFVESSKKGVVVVSFGSNFRSDFMPHEKQQLFLRAFSELSDYHFVWKFESNISSDVLPKNVWIDSWLPISDILANPRVKAIYFHGGMLTTQEAVWRGVPTIIMPFGLDQRQNLVKTQKLRIGEGINYHSLSVNGLKSVLRKVLENSSYASNAKHWSAKFHDQKEKPLDRAIWWIEWLLRNPNSDYLKSPVLRLGFIAGNAYDIVASVILFVVLTTVIILKIVFFCARKCVAKNTNIKRKKVD